MNQTKLLLSSITPVLVMIALIPFVPNDYVLTGVYILIIGGTFLLHKGRRDFVFFAAGFVTISRITKVLEA